MIFNHHRDARIIVAILFLLMSFAQSATTVGVYFQEGVNGPGRGDCNDETMNVLSTLQHLIETDARFSDYIIDTSITSFDMPDLSSKLESFAFFVMPEVGVYSLELVSGWGTTSQEIMRSFVEKGGVLLTMSPLNSSTDFLNSIFPGWDVSDGGYCRSSVPINRGNSAGTTFEGGPTSLGCPSATKVLNCGSVTCTPVYGSTRAASVALLPYGSGLVLFLAWDFYNSGFATSVPGGTHTNCYSRIDTWNQQIFPRALLFAASTARLSQPTETTLAAAPECSDFPVGWHDSGGSQYSCHWYEARNNCRRYGNSYENFGRTANEACCTCGGGALERPPPQTNPPTGAPSALPTARSTTSPTRMPTMAPTTSPTARRTAEPSPEPSKEPTSTPTASPTVSPTAAPTSQPSLQPSTKPTAPPTIPPTPFPSDKPTASPTLPPTVRSTYRPTVSPTFSPTRKPTTQPRTPQPSKAPTATPTSYLSSMPRPVPSPSRKRLPTNLASSSTKAVPKFDPVGTGKICSSNSDCISGTCRNGVCMASPACYPIKHEYGTPFDANRINIVFVGSGFQNGTHEEWRAKVDDTYSVFSGYNMFSQDIRQLNVFIVDPPKLAGPFCAYGCARVDRLLCCNVAEAQRLAAHCFPAGANLQTVVIHNSDKYGGAGYPADNIATISSHFAGPQVAIHELGHSLFELGDEYSYGTGNDLEPNCDSSRTCNKWSDLVGKENTPSGYRTVRCTPGCGNGNYYIAEPSFMDVLDKPVGAVNERFTCCTYLALTKELPTYCDVFDKTPNYLRKYCMNNDYQRYGFSNYNNDTEMLIPGVTPVDDVKYVHVSEPVQVRVKLRKGGDGAKVVGKPTPLSAGLYQKKHVLGDFASAKAAARSGAESLVKVKVFYRTGVEVLLFSIKQTVDIPLVLEDYRMASDIDGTPRSVSEQREIVDVILDTNGREVQKVRTRIAASRKNVS